MTHHSALVGALRTQPNQPAAQLRAALGISRPTLMRAVRAAGPAVLSWGKGRRTAYAARRPLRGSLAPIPVFRIDAAGGYETFGELDLAHPHGSVFRFAAPNPWPLERASRDGWFDGLPYFLQDLRPEGFLGRAFARAHAALLQLPDNPQDWSEDDALHALSLLGADPVGDLLIGNSALQLWLKHLQQPAAAWDEAQLPDAYLALAGQAMAGGLAGSSAAGEFPKFMAARRQDDATTRVLVKFSGNDASPGTQRWSDLLVCEHLAAQTLTASLGIAAAPTRILRAGGRTFLEVERFDRHGAHGRSALCSWAAINQCWFGLAGRPWPQGADALAAPGLIEPRTVHDIARLWHFGELIGNSDMHDGNLSFRPQPLQRRAGFALAPAYDMLPMRYAPQRGVELPPVVFEPPLPLPAAREAWFDSAQAARAFWQQAAQDARISTPFRQICADNLRRLEQLVRLAGRRT